MSRDDVWVAKSTDRLHFLFKSLQYTRIGKAVVGNHFQRNLTAKFGMTRQKDSPHSATAKRTNDFVLANRTDKTIRIFDVLRFMNQSECAERFC